MLKSSETGTLSLFFMSQIGVPWFAGLLGFFRMRSLPEKLYKVFTSESEKRTHWNS